MKINYFLLLLVVIFLTSACATTPIHTDTGNTKIKVLAVESFLGDITQNIAGSRIVVDLLIPPGVDPHEFEPAPADIAKISDSTLIVVNGGGLEPWLDKTIALDAGQQKVIIASNGLVPRNEQKTGGLVATKSGQKGSNPTTDPHFWLDPNLVITYVENIRDGLIAVDPTGKEEYSHNAENYIIQLQELDRWINDQVSDIPTGRRLLVTNHESFGYFADRYGFKIIGTIVPSFSSLAAPSAYQLAQLIELIRSNNVKAIFLETGANPILARQIASETGAKVIEDLYTHSLTPSTGPASTYIEMMRFDTLTIVNALK
jgi:ABC-type Zn uptake system ZnuABC Zn-binding protein ZnuA